MVAQEEKPQKAERMHSTPSTLASKSIKLIEKKNVSFWVERNTSHIKMDRKLLDLSLRKKWQEDRIVRQENERSESKQEHIKRTQEERTYLADLLSTTSIKEEGNKNDQNKKDLSLEAFKAVKIAC